MGCIWTQVAVLAFARPTHGIGADPAWKNRLTSRRPAESPTVDPPCLPRISASQAVAWAAPSPDVLSADCLPQGTAPQRHEGRCGRRFRLEIVRGALAAVPEVALADDNVIASMRMAVSVAKFWVVNVWLTSPRLMEQLKETVAGAACCTTSLG